MSVPVTAGMGGRFGEFIMENKENIVAVVSGTDVEAENRVESDRFLLNTIESEREERMEATRDIINTLTTLGTNDFVLWKELRKHEIVLSVVIGVEIGLLIAMMLIVWQTLS